MAAGEIQPEFIVSNISSEVWYHPMVELAKRLRSPAALQEAVAGMCRGIRQHPANSSILVVGLGETGADIIGSLTDSGSIASSNTLAIDFDCDLRRTRVRQKLPIPYGRVRFLSWAGVHHGGVDHRRMLGIAAAADLEKILAPAASVIMTLALGGALGSGVAPILAAICRMVGKPVHVVASMPLQLTGQTRESEQAVRLLQDLGARVDLTLAEQWLVECRGRGDQIPLAEFWRHISATMAGKVAAKVVDHDRQE